MSIEDRITEILGRHEFLPGNFIVDPQPPRCACGEWQDSGPGANRVRANYLEHVARVLVTELALTEETGFRYTHSANGNSHILMNLDVEAARRMASRSHSLTEVARYVTPWENT